MYRQITIEVSAINGNNHCVETIRTDRYTRDLTGFLEAAIITHRNTGVKQIYIRADNKYGLPIWEFSAICDIRVNTNCRKLARRQMRNIRFAHQYHDSTELWCFTPLEIAKKINVVHTKYLLLIKQHAWYIRGTEYISLRPTGKYFYSDNCDTEYTEWKDKCTDTVYTVFSSGRVLRRE